MISPDGVAPSQMVCVMVC